MPIVSEDIKFYLSHKTAGANNTTAQSNKNLSLGGYQSTTLAGNDVFPNVTGDENATNVTSYRCIFLRNNHGTLTYINPFVWIVSNTAGGTVVSIGVDLSSPGVVVPNEGAAPAGVAFSQPASKLTGLALGDVLPGGVVAIWIRRAAANTPPLNNEVTQFGVSGDTGE